MRYDPLPPGPARGRRRRRSFLRAALAVGSAVCAVSVAADSSRPGAGEDAVLPPAWHAAAVDPDTGGRYVPEANRELRRFQAEVLRSGAPIPYAHFEDPGTVVVAVRAAFPGGEARRRLALLLGTETVDPQLSVLALVDAPAPWIAENLGLPGERLQIVDDGQVGPAHETFPFVRDYAPLVRVVPSPAGFATESLVLFRQSRLNRVVDASLGIVSRRRADVVARKLELSRRLAEIYRERLGRDVPVRTLGVRMDGGNLLTDGRGTCFLSDVVLAKNRGDARFVRRELQDVLGCARSVFLEPSGRLDPLQHVDTFLYLADPENAVLSLPVDDAADPSTERRNLETLLALGYRVHRLPRRSGALSYANILTTRRHVYVPQYSAYLVESEAQRAIDRTVRSLDPERDRARRVESLTRPLDTRRVPADAALRRENRLALETIARLLPGKRVVPFDADASLESHGSWHCLSHELPESLRRPSAE